MSRIGLRVAVAGAGVIGLASARALAARRADVTVLERDRVGSGTGRTTFAWVNANGERPDGYLDVAGLREHARIQRDHPSDTPWFIPSDHDTQRALRGSGSANLIIPGVDLHPAEGGRLLPQSTDLDVHADRTRPADPVGREIRDRARATC